MTLGDRISVAQDWKLATVSFKVQHMGEPGLVALLWRDLENQPELPKARTAVGQRLASAA
jgi:hypothetical protein